MNSKPAREDETPSAGVNWKLFLLVAGIIGIVFVGMLATQSDGNSSDGPPAEISDPGSGINPNPAEADLAVAAEPERSTSVPVKHLTEKEFLRLAKDRRIIKEEILYLCEFKYEHDNSEMPVGFILLDKDRLPDLEFGFEGIYLSNFSLETREDKKYSILTADIERSRYQAVRWNALLLDSNKDLVGSANVNKSEKLNFRFNGNIWEKGEFVFIEMGVVDGIVTTINNK